MDASIHGYIGSSCFMENEINVRLRKTTSNIYNKILSNLFLVFEYLIENKVIIVIIVASITIFAYILSTFSIQFRNLDFFRIYYFSEIDD